VEMPRGIPPSGVFRRGFAEDPNASHEFLPD
jgi:hypothetical protein